MYSGYSHRRFPKGSACTVRRRSRLRALHNSGTAMGWAADPQRGVISPHKNKGGTVKRLYESVAIVALCARDFVERLLFRSVAGHQNGRWCSKSRAMAMAS
jgi:hypothetical protein